MTSAILIVVAVVIGYLIYRSKKAAVPPSEPKATVAAPYAGVVLWPGKRPCSAARELAGQKLLAAQARPLPLPACTQVTCNCRYRKVSDRRQEGRRTIDFGIEAVVYGGEERRSGLDRRDSL
jgi:hypothetical protein